MTLTNRLTAFFLAALALVLAAFSGTLYFLAHAHLMRQLDDQAVSCLDTLVAATELEPDGLEWDRRERSISPKLNGQGAVWAIFDTQEMEVDGASEHVRLLRAYLAEQAADHDHRQMVNWDAEPWWVFRRSFSHPQQGIVERRAKAGEPRVPGDERYQTLVYLVALPLGPVNGTLRMLAWSLLGVSVAVWGFAALGSRWFCRRALAPLTKISNAANEISADKLDTRLPVSTNRDELRELATSFNGLMARLQESFERQRRFTGEASHQLRTPLTAMLGQLEVALRHDREPEEYRRVIATAIAQAGRLRQIVEALLFLARADAEAHLPELEAMDLTTWLPRHVETWSSHPRFSDLQLDPPENRPLPVLAQPTLLGQAMDNLIDNAIKYSQPGTPVRIQLAVAADEVILVIKDQGIGISAADLERVFDPFFRSEDGRRRGVAGLGLGLAVSERIVRAVGGSIKAASEVGEGSSFSVRLSLNGPGRLN